MKGVNYLRHFFSMSKISLIIVLTTLTSIHNLVKHQLDVKIALLNGELEDEIYID